MELVSGNKNLSHLFFQSKKILFAPIDIENNENYYEKWKNKLIANKENEVLIWGVKAPSFIDQCENPKLYIEDGFIRSVSLGASKALPFSLTIDRSTPYFDATKASDLETLLATYDFKSDSDLISRSRNCIAKILATGISKYNHSKRISTIQDVYGEKKKKRILVIGQVEDDASIMLGCRKRVTNNDLVCIAKIENPDAEIIYKPHPDVLANKRKMYSNPADVAHLCKIVTIDIPISQAFETIDHVYTITSQTGFEAALRGIRVTTIGCPFYSGWGITDDRQICNRRLRKLSVEEVFAASYILYPTYINPYTKQRIEIEDAIDAILALR